MKLVEALPVIRVSAEPNTWPYRWLWFLSHYCRIVVTLLKSV